MLSINIGQCNIFHIADETMLFVMVKACLCLKIIMLFRALNDYFFIYTDINRMRPLMNLLEKWKTNY